MRNYENPNRFIKTGIMPHQIFAARTSEPDYEMSRDIILVCVDDIDEWDEYLYLEGYHCSCYDFDDTNWDGTVYTKEELLKLAESYPDDIFWKSVIKAL